MHRPTGDHPISRRQVMPTVCLAVLLLGMGLVIGIGTSQAAGGTGTIGGRVTYVGGMPGDHPMLVCLYGGDPDPDCRAPSAIDGAYRFDDLADGDYTVKALVNVYRDDALDWDTAVEAWYDPDADGLPDPVTAAGGYVWGIDISVGGPWIPLGGPTMDGGWVDALGVDADDADVVYAVVREPYGAGHGELFKSTDGGASWVAVYAPSARVYDLAARGDRVCLSGAHGQETVLMCSGDAGATWSKRDAIMPGYVVQALDIAISTEVSSTLLLAGRVVTITDGTDIDDIDLTYGLPAVLRSVNGGQTWQRVVERPSHAGALTAFHALAEDPSSPGRFFLGGDDAWIDIPGMPAGSIYRVEGGNWAGATNVYAGENPGPVRSLAIDPADGNVILASTSHNVLRSADGGDTWEEVLAEGGEPLTFAPDGYAYLAATNGMVYASTDGGQTWDDGAVIDGFCDGFAAGANLYAGGCIDGVLRSTDGGATWTPSSAGITSLVSPRSLAWDPFDRQRLYAAAGALGGWRSADGGPTWTLDLDGNAGAYATHPWKQGIVYRGIQSASRGSLERSIDSGEHWGVVYTPTMAYDDSSPTEGAILAIAPAPSWPATVYAGGFDKPATGDLLTRRAVIVRSTAGGVAGSWAEVHRMAAGSWVEALAVDPTTRNVAYAGGAHGATHGFVKRTVDGGVSWVQVFTDTHPVRSIAIDRRDPRTVYVATAAERVVRSVDGGDTWTPVRLPTEDGGGPSGALVVADPRAPRRVYLAGEGTVLESSDRGETWIEQYNALAPAPQQIPSALMVVHYGDLQTFYLSSGGLWSFTRRTPWPESRLFLPAFLGPSS